MSTSPVYLHGRSPEPDRLWTSRGFRPRDDHLQVGMHSEAIAARPRRAQFPGSCLGFQGGDDGVKCRPEGREQLSKGGQWVWVLVPNRRGGAAGQQWTRLSARPQNSRQTALGASKTGIAQPNPMPRANSRSNGHKQLQLSRGQPRGLRSFQDWMPRALCPEYPPAL